MRGLVILLLVAAVSAAPKSPNRIIGGSVTTINEYPEMVVILYSVVSSGHRHSCGGTILNTRSILTAAHCTIGDPVSRWRVRVGSTFANSGGVVHDAVQIINHPQYELLEFPNNYLIPENDISIIRVSPRIIFTNLVRPGVVAGSRYFVPDNEIVWATGWGVADDGQLSEQLRHVQVWKISLQACRVRYNAMQIHVTDNMLCSGWLDVGGRDQCSGDSGGPLFHQGVVVGICSWGAGCASPDYPGVNARVSRYTEWIAQNA